MRAFEKTKAPAGASAEAFKGETTQAREGIGMNTTRQMLKAAIPGFSVPAGARAVLVADEGDGTFSMWPVHQGESVLDIKTGLLDHLSSSPQSDEFLRELHDYCASRLAAREEARRTGGVVIARKHGLWEIAHVSMFAPVQTQSVKRGEA